MENHGTWLDPETREMLQAEPPRKLSPATVLDYSLVLLRSDGDPDRMVRAVRRVNACSDREASVMLSRRLPLTINADLSFDNALFGQFEFICCDAVAVVLASEVAMEAPPTYLKELFAKLRQSDEFRHVVLAIESVPQGNDGERFVDQFLGPAKVSQPFPMQLPMMYKKARIMSHWASRIGAVVRIANHR